MLVTPLALIQIFIKRMLVDWPKCGSDPRDEGHLACLRISLLEYSNITPICLVWMYNLYLWLLSMYTLHTHIQNTRSNASRSNHTVSTIYLSMAQQTAECIYTHNYYTDNSKLRPDHFSIDFKNPW